MNWVTEIIQKHRPGESNNGVETQTGRLSREKTIETDSEPIPYQILNQLVPVNNLSHEELVTFQKAAEIYGPGDIIFSAGETNDSVLYLIDGTLSIKSSDESLSEIEASDRKARFPLCYGKTHNHNACAKTPVKILRLPIDVLEIQISNAQQKTKRLKLSELKFPAKLTNNRFFHNFFAAYQKNKVELPRLPTIANKLQKALQSDISIAEAAAIVQLDPAIVPRLIQVSNSPLYSYSTPTKSCLEAVKRLGLPATRNIVISLGIKQLFRSKNKKLNKYLVNLWKKSLHLSSLCSVLSSESKTIDPDTALLAGLVVDIGVLPLIHHAGSIPESDFSFAELEMSITPLRGLIGKLTLEAFDFPWELHEVPLIAENWYYNEDEKLTLNDIVILAKFHSYIGGSETSELPLLTTLPAFQKLSRNGLSPDSTMNLLKTSRLKVAESIKQVFS